MLTVNTCLYKVVCSLLLEATAGMSDLLAPTPQANVWDNTWWAKEEAVK